MIQTVREATHEEVMALDIRHAETGALAGALELVEVDAA